MKVVNQKLTPRTVTHKRGGFLWIKHSTLITPYNAVFPEPRHKWWILLTFTGMFISVHNKQLCSAWMNTKQEQYPIHLKGHLYSSRIILLPSSCILRKLEFRAILKMLLYADIFPLQFLKVFLELHLQHMHAVYCRYIQ